MPKSLKKSWTVSNLYTGRTGNTFFMMSFYVIWPLKHKSFLIISSNFLRIKSLKCLMQPLNFDEAKLLIWILQILHKYPHFFFFTSDVAFFLLSTFWVAYDILNQNVKSFIKGGLILEYFSLWLKSPQKKGLKSRLWALST